MPFSEFESQFKCVRQYKVLRKRKKMKQQDVADITGISVQSITFYECGRRTPSLENLIKMIHAVGGNDLDITGWDL